MSGRASDLQATVRFDHFSQIDPKTGRNVDLRYFHLTLDNNSNAVKWIRLSNPAPRRFLSRFYFSSGRTAK